LLFVLLLCACRPARDAHPWPENEGDGWRCLAHHPVGSYEHTCERPGITHLDEPPFVTGGRPMCGLERPMAIVEQPKAACFRHGPSPSNDHWLCMARMDECEATRARLLAAPETMFWFQRAILGNAACVEPLPVETTPKYEASSCGWYD
jgi:hypothetical protein